MQPTYHPISMLPTIATMIDGCLTHAEESLALYREALPKPYVLDNHTIMRMVRSLEEDEHFVPIYEEQLARWARDPHENDAVIAHLRDKVARWRATVTETRAVVEELRRGTIENVLGAIDTLVEAFAGPDPDLS